MTSLLAALDIYVSPSYSESFGIATLEAMAAGVAVVATKTDGSRELINDDTLLVPFGDPVALAVRIVKLIGDDNQLRSLGEALQRRAKENYSLEAMVIATESIYQEILSS